MMEEEQQGLKERSLEFKLKERKETGGKRKREEENPNINAVHYGCLQFLWVWFARFFFFLRLVPLTQRNKTNL